MKKEDLELIHEAARLNEWSAGSDIEKQAYSAITAELNKPVPKKAAAPKAKTAKKGK